MAEKTKVESVDEMLARLQENEQASSQIRYVEAEIVKLTVAQLREFANKNPEHPTSKSFLKSVHDFPGNLEVNVNKVDLEAMMKNEKTVYVRQTETVPLAPGEEKPEKGRVSRKVLASDPNVKDEVKFDSQ